MELLHDLRASVVHGRSFAVLGVCFGAFAAYAPLLKAQAGLGDAEFGLALLVGASGAVSAMWLAPRVDRALGGLALVICALLLPAAFILPSLAQSWLGFAAAMFVASSAGGLFDVVANARLSGHESRIGRSLMNLNHGLFSLSYAVSALGAGLLREVGVAPAWCYVGLLGLAAVMALGMRDPVIAEPEDGTAKTVALPNLLIVVAGVIVLIAFTSEQATENWSALHLERSFGVGAAEGALGPAILGFTMAIGRIGGQEVVRRVAEGRLMQIAAALASFGMFLGAFAPTLMLAYLGFGILGIGVAAIGPTALAWVGKTLPSRHRAVAISRMVMIAYCGFFVGPPAIGFLAEAFGLPMALATMGALLLGITFVLVPTLRALARKGAMSLA